MPKAVIYCRVSSADQVDNTSLGTQELACRSWCERNGLDVSGVYIDAGESAKSADRPQFLRMVADCQKRDISSVVVYRLDRFARNTLDHCVYAHKLKQAGASLVSVSEPIEDNPGGRMMESVYAAMAQFDNDVRSARAKDAMKAIKAKGGWTHKPPFGFRIIRVNGLPMLEPDPDQSAIVRQAFAMLAAGRNMLAVYEDLRPPIGRTAFYRIFQKDIYAQIDPDGYRKVQETMGWTRPRSDRSEDFPLRGALICAHCGRPLTASMAKGKYPYYHCKNKGHAYISLEDLDLAIRGIMADISGPLTLAMPALKAYVADKAKEKAAVSAREGDQAARELRKAEAKLDRLQDALIDGRIEGQDYDRKRDALKADIARHRETLARMRRSEASDLELIIEAEDKLTDLVSMWNGIAPRNRPRMVRQMFPRGIEIDGKTVRTSASDSIFGVLLGNDTGFFRMASPRGMASNLRAWVEVVKEVA